MASANLGGLGPVNIASISATTKGTPAVNADAVLIKDSEDSNKLKFITVSNLPSGSSADEKVKIDVASTAGYIGATSNDGILRVDSTLDYTDGGNYVTVGLASTLKSNYDAGYAHISDNGSDHSYIDQDVTSGSAPVLAGTNFTGVIKQGVKNIWIPATQMYPTITAGCSVAVKTELTAGRPNKYGINFDGTSQEYAQFLLEFPKSWNAGTIEVQFKWTSVATDTDGVRWGCQAVAVNDGDTIDVAFGTAQEVTDNAQSTANLFYETAYTSAITIAGSPTSEEGIYFQVYRDPTHGDDGMTEDATLLGVRIKYTVNASDDT